MSWQCCRVDPRQHPSPHFEWRRSGIPILPSTLAYLSSPSPNSSRSRTTTPTPSSSWDSLNDEMYACIIHRFLTGCDAVCRLWPTPDLFIDDISSPVTEHSLASALYSFLKALLHFCAACIRHRFTRIAVIPSLRRSVSFSYTSQAYNNNTFHAAPSDVQTHSIAFTNKPSRLLAPDPRSPFPPFQRRHFDLEVPILLMANGSGMFSTTT
ncbi:hypothetical protein R3P38DRAFT_3182531 [Favolaschia claudopus]|uniref:Uncharacterized protein n=1 Tax=Favolaschia claudopus TaxID=2862362 RepID=A0AAW0CJP5_9AGAR